jgi:hypothetical protein
MPNLELKFGEKQILTSGNLHRIGKALYIGKTEKNFAFLTYNGKIKCYHVKDFKEHCGELWAGPFPAQEVNLTKAEEELAKATWRRYKNA